MISLDTRSLRFASAMYFLFRSHGPGAIDIALVTAGIGLIIGGDVLIGSGPILAVFILELQALFRSQLIVRALNNRIQCQLLREFGADPDASADRAGRSL